MSDRHHLHWATALDRLELDVIRAERLLADPSRPSTSRATPYGGGPEQWDEPLVEGPIPADLRERALDLQARQQALRVAMVARLGALGRQHELTSRVDRATRQARVGASVYLDVTA
jgi:hypothetical protein